MVNSKDLESQEPVNSVDEEEQTQLMKFANDLNRTLKELNTKHKELQEAYDRQKEIQETLKASEENLRDLYNEAPIAYFSLDRDKIINNCNSMAEKLCGFSKSELLGKNFNIFFTGTPDSREKFNRVYNAFLLGNVCQNERIQIKNKNSRLIWGSLSVNAIYDLDKNITGSRCMIMDINEQVKMESGIQRAKLAEAANKAKSEFLAHISHEMRTPIHGILSFSRFGVKKIDSAAKDKLLNYFMQIKLSGKRLLALLDNLLDLSKLEMKKMEFKMEESDIFLLINSVAEEFSTTLIENDLVLEIINPPEPAVCLFDKTKTGQVVRNLISNAVKFSPKGKKIIVSAEKSKIKINKRLIPCLEIRIADQGAGIPADELETVFEKFKQSSKNREDSGGTGLGLAICREIITAHKGKIWAEQNPDGEGSVFIFTLLLNTNRKDCE